MIRRSMRSSQGDTIVEVLFAFAVFSLIAVASITLMNLGTSTAEQALETTLVRQQIDAQAETLRYLNAAYAADVGTGTLSPAAQEWQGLVDRSHTDSVPDLTAGVGEACPDIPGDAYILNTHTAKASTITTSASPPAYSQVIYNGDTIQATSGIWIESLYKSPSTVPVPYVDFHIYTCWEGANSSHAATIGTVVRLYEPQA